MKTTPTVKHIIAWISLFIGLLSIDLKAQNYPVHATINVIQPVGVSLAELQQSVTPKIQASFILTDLNRPSFDIRFRITIEGRGVILRANTFSVLPAVSLQAGQPLLIDQQVLIPYLKVQNLTIEGLNQSAFLNGGLRLPEGYYNICIEAIDANDIGGLQVSNTACTNVMLIEYDPPLLMVPTFANTILFEDQPPAFQQGLFMWQPMHFGFFPVEYQLDIFRGLPGMDMLPGRDLVTYLPPYLSIKTTNTFYNLLPTDPVLNIGEYYYAMVTVRPINYPAIFKNGGKSQFVQFNISKDDVDQCTAPQDYRGTIDRHGIALRWKTYQNCAQYITEYYDEADGIRQYQMADIGQGGSLVDTIHEVYSRRTYIVRTGCQCQSDTLYSDTIRLYFDRPKAQIPPYACGVENDSVAGIEVLLPELHVDDTIVAADFKMIVRLVTGSNGTYSGKGHIEIPYFKYARVNGVFQNIRVNDEYRLVGGEIHIIGAGQNVLDDGFLAFLDSLNSTLEDISNTLGDSIARLDSLAAMQDYLKQNGPQWLLDSIAIVEAALANVSDPDERKRLEEMLQDLLSQSREWELMYVNLIIECVNYLDSIYHSKSDEITSNYNSSLSITTNAPFSNLPDPDIEINISEFKEIKIPWDQYKQGNPEQALQVENNLKQEMDYTLKLILSGLLSELDQDRDQTYNLLLLFNKVGKNVIPSFKNEFESRGWDKVAILEDYSIIPILSEYVKDALIKIYFKI